jgi:hypothetical protein
MSDPDDEPKYDLEAGSYNTAPEPVSDTEVPLLQLVKIVLVFMAIVYLMTVLYERSVVNNPYGAGTGDRPTGLENGVQSSGGDGGIKAVPWK